MNSVGSVLEKVGGLWFSAICFLLESYRVMIPSMVSGSKPVCDWAITKKPSAWPFVPSK